jgi:hypothetical protein
MFPDARNSLRRWSESAQTKIPIPVAITLHNYFVPPPTGTKPSERSSSLKTTNDDDNNNETSSPSPSKEDEEVAYRSRGMWLHRQTQHNSNLLPRLNLEITATIARQQKDDEEEEDKDKDNVEASVVVVYSQKTPQTRSVHPSWEHLDERICIPAYRKNCDNKGVYECSAHWWDDNELYKSMKVKLCILPHDEENGGKPHTVISNDVQKKKQEEEIICDDSKFLETFLHPSLLERIDLGPSKNNNDSNIKEGDLDDYLTKLPPALPSNAMLVHFSDGSIRCPSNIYEILWDNYGTHGILEPPPVEDFSRFEDDVFNTLDHAKQTPQRSRARSVSSLLDNDYNDQHNDGEDDSIPRQLLQNEELSTSLLREQENPTTPPRRPLSIGRVSNKEIIKQKHQQTQQINAAYSCSEQDILKEDRIQEKRNLLRLIAEEERALKEDCDSLQYEQKTMLGLMKEVQVVERDICRVKIELNKQSLKWEREEFLKGAQSIKLFRDLRDIYPITLDSIAAQSSSFNNTLYTSTTGTGGKGYLIRGLRLPVDIYTTGILEEEVNASLGYCAHLIFMVAKYLTIQLRHRIFCNGSRSAIELDGVGVFPLFLGRLAARALEREQVDRGARLLGTNVDCILMHLNLLPSSSSCLQQYHILARLQIIQNFVAEGNSGGISHSDSLPI